MSDYNIWDAHKYSIRNAEALKSCKTAACYYCRRFFYVSDIKEWTDNGETALCPYCGIDAVLPETSPYPMTNEVLNELHENWFR